MNAAQITLTAPTLARIANEIAERPSYLADAPYLVDGSTFMTAEAELEIVMKERGFPVPRSADISGQNFLLFGKVVVAANG